MMIHDDQYDAKSDSAVCSRKRAEHCFMNLFNKIMDTCGGSGLLFSCYHYNFIDLCISIEAGNCSKSQVGHYARTAYHQQKVICEKERRFRHDAKARQRTSTMHRRTLPHELQFISLFGYLQTKCARVKAGNCRDVSGQEGLDECEKQLRYTDSNEWLRHKLLRLRLDSPKKQLSSQNHQQQCSSIHSALTEIYLIHRTYCPQIYATRCFCNSLNEKHSCNIDCSQVDLQFHGASLSWSELRDQYSASKNCFHDRIFFIALPVLVLILN
uniref:GDNF domain-containing protein n=1 Tax=Syphacia muris TaxID=451379 RepID=A0A0N5AT25_9BILA